METLYSIDSVYCHVDRHFCELLVSGMRMLYEADIRNERKTNFKLSDSLHQNSKLNKCNTLIIFFEVRCVADEEVCVLSLSLYNHDKVIEFYCVVHKDDDVVYVSPRCALHRLRLH
jgi:hypothetical protein